MQRALVYKKEAFKEFTLIPISLSECIKGNWEIVNV